MTRKVGAPIRWSQNQIVHHSQLPEHAAKIIRRRAYELYEKRGRQDGHAEEDWQRAEAEVLGTLLRRGGTE
jgi:hypothetical protein